MKIQGMTQQEREALKLRAIYESAGYKKFKMSRFEEYSLYLENKSFLNTEGIVTFTNPAGKLMALKPDVTLSIMKSMRYDTEFPTKLYYTENVYRSVKDVRDIREIMQVGLEYLGEVTIYAQLEVLTMAMESLERLDKEYILDISHMGLVSELLNSSGLREEAKSEALTLISTKNSHELKRLCERENVSDSVSDRLCSLSSLSGNFGEVLPIAKNLAISELEISAVSELEKLFVLLSETGDTSRLRLDFSIVNDMSYYNGLVFKGYIPDVPEGILSGGQYDKLVQRISKATGAIGFAVYISLLEHRKERVSEFDVDVLVICSNDKKAKEVMLLSKKLRSEGKTVRVQPSRSDISACEVIEI